MLDSKCYNSLCMYKRLLSLTVLYQLLLGLNHYAMLMTTYEFMNIKSDHIGQYQASRYLLVYYIRDWHHMGNQSSQVCNNNRVPCVLAESNAMCRKVVGRVWYDRKGYASIKVKQPGPCIESKQHMQSRHARKRKKVKQHQAVRKCPKRS